MNKDIIKGKWKEIQGKLTEQWGKLTNDDVTRMDGSLEQWEGTLQKKYGYQKDEADKEIERFMEKYHFDDKQTH